MSGLAKNKNFNYQGSNAILQSGMSYILDATALTADFYALMGNKYLKLKDYKLSIEHYKKALNMVADDQMTIRNELAFAQSYEPAMLKNAQSIIEACLELQPLNSDFLNTYAVILSKQGQDKEAEIKIEKALELAPNQIEKAKYLETKGDILYRKGEVNAAVSFWEKAEKMGVKSSAIHTKISTLQLAE